MAKQKFRPTRLSGFSGVKAYIWYVEVLKKCCNAVGRTFCDAIFVGLDKKEGVWRDATRRCSDVFFGVRCPVLKPLFAFAAVSTLDILKSKPSVSGSLDAGHRTFLRATVHGVHNGAHNGAHRWGRQQTERGYELAGLHHPLLGRFSLYRHYHRRRAAPCSARCWDGGQVLSWPLAAPPGLPGGWPRSQ